MPTKIERRDEVWNPATGCTKLDAGCKNCYAERMSKRLAGRFGYPADDPFKVTLHPDRLGIPLYWKKPRRVFVNSMSDLFHKDVPPEFIVAVYGAMACVPRHQYMILTKRPERALEFLTQSVKYTPEAWDFVWLGVSVHDQASADERIPILLQTPAAHRFVSFEPALGAVDFGRFLKESGKPPHANAMLGYLSTGGQWLDLIITGGESGPGGRPMHPDIPRSTRDQCAAANIPFHFKQWGAYKPIYGAGDDPDGKSVMALPDGTITDTEWNGGPGPHLRGSQAMYRMSKKSAQRHRVYPSVPQYPCIDNDGRSLLDGVVHDG